MFAFARVVPNHPHNEFLSYLRARVPQKKTKTMWRSRFWLECGHRPGSAVKSAMSILVGRTAALRVNIELASLVAKFLCKHLSPCALLAAMTISALWTCAARAEPASTVPPALAQQQFVCHLPGMSDRRISIYRPSGPQRCRVDYTRDGKTRSLWSSGHDYQFCVRKALDIVGLLEQVNFTCTPKTREVAGAASSR
jgi:hypothetical protein